MPKLITGVAESVLYTNLYKSISMSTARHFANFKELLN